MVFSCMGVHVMPYWIWEEFCSYFMEENTALGIDKHWDFNQHPKIMIFF